MLIGVSNSPGAATSIVSPSVLNVARRDWWRATNFTTARCRAAPSTGPSRVSETDSLNERDASSPSITAAQISRCEGVDAKACSITGPANGSKSTTVEVAIIVNSP